MLSVALIATLLAAAQAASGRQVLATATAAPNASSDSPSAAVLAPRMSCTGGVLAARTCYFEDLLWDIEQQRFAFFGPAHTQPHMMSDRLLTASELDPAEPWIKLRRGVTDPPGGTWTLEEFYMDWRVGETPPEEAAIVDAPHAAVHLRTIMNLNSIGHFLRDSLMPLVNVALRFGLDPRDFLWVMCPSSEIGQWSTLKRDLPLLDHYESWIPSRAGQPHRVLWTDMMADYLGDSGEARSQRYVRFRKVLAGRGSTALDVHVSADPRGNINRMYSTWAHMCTPWPWREMRAVAYGNNGVTMTPAAHLKPLVVISDGQPHEKRRFENGKAMAKELQRELPGVEVMWSDISALSGKEQIELLSRTTVLVSTIGSRSFRLIYLPDGAQMIIVSPPVWQKPDGRGTFPFPFDETDRCWGFLGYVSVLRYHTVIGPVSEQPEPADQKTGFAAYLDRRDRTVVLEKERFLPIVRQALGSVRVWEVPDFATGRDT